MNQILIRLYKISKIAVILAPLVRESEKNQCINDVWQLSGNMHSSILLKTPEGRTGNITYSRCERAISYAYHSNISVFQE